MVEATTRIGLIIALVFYLGFVLAVTPFFDPDAYNIVAADLPTGDDFEPNILTLIADVFARFGILVTVSTNDPIVALILTPLALGFVWAIIEVIAIAIP